MSPYTEEGFINPYIGGFHIERGLLQSPCKRGLAKPLGILHIQRKLSEALRTSDTHTYTYFIFFYNYGVLH